MSLPGRHSIFFNDALENSLNEDAYARESVLNV